MPNRKTHQTIGAVSGGVTSLLLSHGEEPLNRFIETLGGAFMGYHSGHWADRLDPPTSPRHRAAAHGVIPVAAANCVGLRLLKPSQAWLREKADIHKQKSLEAVRTLESFLHFLLELLCRFVSGALAGLLGGYDSHLLADATTKAGLPLLA
jgi:hypothetical protein